MKRYVTRGDIVLICILTFLSLASLGGMRYMSFSGNHVVIEVDGRRVSDLSLDRDAKATATGPLGETVVVVENGVVQVESSPCPRDHCMHMGKIRYSGEILVCIPNRVFVSIRGSADKEPIFDGVSE